MATHSIILVWKISRTEEAGLGWGGWPIVQRVSKSDTTVYLSTHACKQKERSKIVSFFADGIDFSTEKIDLTTKLS